MHLNHESELLEELAESSSAKECLLCAFDILEDMVDALLKRIFHKDDYSVKFVVDPLLTNDGPLGGILVRTKLLLGLGVITKEVYDDIMIFVTLKEWVKTQEDSVDFWDPDLIFELNRVNAIQRTMPVDYAPDLIANMSESMTKMFMDRHFHKVRSTIVLAINHIQLQLRQNNSLTS